MAAWSLELLDMIACWVSSCEMLCQAFVTAAFRCLFVAVGLRSAGWLGLLWIFQFMDNRWVVGSLFVLGHHSPVIWSRNLSREYRSIHSWIHLAVTSLINCGDPVPVADIHDHVCLHHVWLKMCFGSWAVLSPLWSSFRFIHVSDQMTVFKNWKDVFWVLSGKI